MKEKFAALIDLKSIVTLVLIGALTYGFIAKFVSIEVFAPVVASVIAYFFNKSPSVPANTTTTVETKTTNAEVK